MIKVAIIGCGKIADLHADQIQYIKNARIVGVCDTEELMARQLSDRLNIKHYFTDVNELLKTTKPDIVHITTPPQSHYNLGKTCLEAGCSVYMEKPFTINFNEADTLISIAKKNNVKITVGHNSQFSPVAVRMRELIHNGFLGGSPVHLESTFCYDLGDPTFAKAMLGDKHHWVRKLPGKLLHNIISHGISLISELMELDNPEIIAHGFPSPFLQKIGENNIVDELRVIIHDSKHTTAYFTFSSQISPKLHRFCVYGPKNSLVADDDNQTLITLKPDNYKSYLNMFIPSINYAKQYVGNFATNVKCFLKNDFHMSYRYKVLFEKFYRAVKKNEPLPISYKEILFTSKVMDEIFSQVKQQ